MITISSDSTADEVIDFWVYEYNLLKSKYDILRVLADDMYITLINEIGKTQATQEYRKVTDVID